MGKARTAARKPVRPYVMAMTAFQLTIHATDPVSQAVVKSLGGEHGWFTRSTWTVDVDYDEDRKVAAIFRTLRDAGFGFEDNTRDQGTPAQTFDELVKKGLLDGECRRVGHSIDGIGRPDRK
jgi:hypothetical protein